MLFFSFWLTSLCMTVLRSFHVTKNDPISFLKMWWVYTMDIQHLTYSTLLERLFQLSENVNTNMSRYPGGLPRQHCGKELPTSAGDTRDTGSIPGAGRSLGVGNPTHSRILAWKTPWREEPGRLRSSKEGSQSIRRSWMTTHTGLRGTGTLCVSISLHTSCGHWGLPSLVTGRSPRHWPSETPGRR